MTDSNKGLAHQIEQYFSKEIRPQIQLDGGDIYLLGIEPYTPLYEGGDKGEVEGGYKVRVSLAGACVGCGLSTITLQMGVEARLKEKFAEIREIEVV